MLSYEKYFDTALNYFFPGNCFETLLVKFDLLNENCAPILLSRLLGIAITLGSTFLLVPQIQKIFSARSGRGISLIAQILGLVAAAGNAAYSYEMGFDFGQWGDSFFVAVQTVFIIQMILAFDNRSTYLPYVVIAFSWSIGMAVAHHYVPIRVLELVQAANGPVVFVSKGVQIVQNYRQSGTGQLSISSVVMQFGGCVARIFTSIQETGDKLIISTYVLAAVFNGIILAQIIHYDRVEKARLDWMRVVAEAEDEEALARIPRNRPIVNLIGARL